MSTFCIPKVTHYNSTFIGRTQQRCKHSVVVAQQFLSEANGTSSYIFVFHIDDIYANVWTCATVVVGWMSTGNSRNAQLNHSREPRQWNETAHYCTSDPQFSCCQRCHCWCCRRVFASHTNSSNYNVFNFSHFAIYILHDAPSVHFDNNRRECIQHSSGNSLPLRCDDVVS